MSFKRIWTTNFYEKSMYSNILFLGIALLNFVYFRSTNCASNILYLLQRRPWFSAVYAPRHLVRDCKSRVDGLQNITDNTTSMPEVFVLRIGIVGNFTADNLKLISKRTGGVPFSIPLRKYIRFVIIYVLSSI